MPNYSYEELYTRYLDALDLVEHLSKCMAQAGLQCFMSKRSPEEVAKHLHNILDSWESKINELEAQNLALRLLLEGHKDSD